MWVLCSTWRHKRARPSVLSNSPSPLHSHTSHKILCQEADLAWEQGLERRSHRSFYFMSGRLHLRKREPGCNSLGGKGFLRTLHVPLRNRSIKQINKIDPICLWHCSKSFLITAKVVLFLCCHWSKHIAASLLAFITIFLDKWPASVLFSESLR